jgi:hypothetical protein
MKGLRFAVCFMAVTVAVVALWPHPPTLAKNAPATLGQFIGSQQVFLNNSELDPNENYQVIRAFVRTGSLNFNCLVTLGDSNFAVVGTVTFCAGREPAGLGKGILLSVFYPQPPPSGLILNVTLFQEGATAYAPPVLCDVSGC